MGFEFGEDEGELVFAWDVGVSGADEDLAFCDQVEDAFERDFEEFGGCEEVPAVFVEGGEAEVGLPEKRLEG